MPAVVLLPPEGFTPLLLFVLLLLFLVYRALGKVVLGRAMDGTIQSEVLGFTLSTRRSFPFFGNEDVSISGLALLILALFLSSAAGEDSS